LLIGAALYRVARGRKQSLPMRAPIGHTGIAAWSFLMATAHGAGLMLLPALLPLCLAAGATREITASGSLLLALAAVGLHMAAMLGTTGVVAGGVCHGIVKCPAMMGGDAGRHAWTAALGITGGLLIALR
jgi:hypothetical protein